jgi:hypothetical protein
MIFSENRCTLFGIMLYLAPPWQRSELQADDIERRAVPYFAARRP